MVCSQYYCDAPIRNGGLKRWADQRFFCLKDFKALVLLKPNLQLDFLYLKNIVLAALFCVKIYKFLKTTL